MVVIIILLVIGIVGYFIYQSLPNTKYEKAKNFYNAKDYTQAINILNDIFTKHPGAPSKLAECKFQLCNQTNMKNDKLKYFNEVIGLGKRIKNPVTLANFQSVEAKALFEIAKIQYEEARGNTVKLNANIRFIDKANKKGSESNFSSLKTKHLKDLADINFKIACEKEKVNQYSEAIQVYKKAIEYSEKSNNNYIKNNSIARIEICNLKQLSLEYN